MKHKQPRPGFELKSLISFSTMISVKLIAPPWWHYVGGRPELEISDETGSWGGKAGPREARGAVGKRNPERVSWRRETWRGSRERTAEGTSQDELAFQSGQRSAAGGSEEDGQRWVGIPSGFCRSFAKNTLPAIVYKMHEKLYKKNVTKLPFLHLELT